MYIERGPAGTVETIEAGDWPYRIDTAFACLNVDNSEFSQSYPDVLIAGGAGNDGRLCKLGSWPAEYSYTVPYPSTNQLSFVESIPNWTPLTDLSVNRLSGLPSHYGHNRCSVFVANGANPHGEVSELRRGLQSFVDYSCSGMHGCTGLWVLDYGSQTVEVVGKTARQHYVVFAVTTPPETLVIRIIRTQHEVRGEFSGAWEDGAWQVEQLPNEDEPAEDGVMREMETISACPWSENFALQVTQKEVRLLRRLSLQQSDSIVYPESLLLAACKPGVPFVAVSFRESYKIYLEIAQVSEDGHFLRATAQNSRIQLDHDPTCIELFEVDGDVYVFVSTFDLRVFLLRVDDEGLLHPLFQDSLASASIDGVHMVLESAVLLSAREKPTLVCATRSGYLLTSPLPAVGQSK
jgi:hypothetical protein